MIKTVVGSFDTVSEAASAARDLRAAGFTDSDVSVIANNQQRPVDSTVTVTDPDKASGTATGIVAGGALGGAAGLAASLLGLAIPGIGPILAAGPIAAADASIIHISAAPARVAAGNSLAATTPLAGLTVLRRILPHIGRLLLIVVANVLVVASFTSTLPAALAFVIIYGFGADLQFPDLFLVLFLGQLWLVIRWM